MSPLPGLLHVGSDGLLLATLSPLPKLNEPGNTGHVTHGLLPVGEEGVVLVI